MCVCTPPLPPLPPAPPTRHTTGDLKASNILLVFNPTAPYARSAKVADFGLARVHAVGETHRSTRTLGTVRRAATCQYASHACCC
jgi:serine/threonine protein kinase